jgi:predicted CXXCH cytochrome family protein
VNTHFKNVSKLGSRFLIGSLLLTGLAFGQLTKPNVSNPHGGTDCAVCHTDKQSPSGKNLVDNLCTQCHNATAVNTLIHPIYDVNTKSDRISIPKNFKLDPDGSLGCLTCHKVVCKTDRSNRAFLRGGPYRRELDFCYNCHSRDNYKKMNPHKQIDTSGKVDNATCLQCHVNQPSLADHSTIALEMHLDMAATCNKCHALHSHEQNHQGKNIELSKKATVKRFRETQKKFGVKLPLSKDNLIQCNTCHYTHNRGTLAKDQVVYEGDGENQRYLRLSKENLCYACHDL